MDNDLRQVIVQLLAPNGPEIGEDVMTELLSIVRVHSLSPQELSFKWESYNIKMDPAKGVTLNLDNVRDFKKDINDTLERETRAKGYNEKRVVGATPRAGKGADLFDLIDGVAGTPSTNKASASFKRKSQFATPVAKASKHNQDSSPSNHKTPQTATSNVPFAERKGAGEITESLNPSMELAAPPEVPFLESRTKLMANSQVNKFAYRPMAMKLSAASEILDDRLDMFLELVQQHHNLSDSAFGNPTSQSPNEIIAVGRIASEAPDTRLNSASIVLETSRKTGAGLRVPLKLDDVRSFDLFPGKIVALKGKNPSGDVFVVSDFLDIPLLGPAASTQEDMSNHFRRMQAGSEDGEIRPLNIVVAAGPYTSDDNLAYEPLHALCEKAEQTRADALVLVGPFLDSEHPLVASGDFPDLPSNLRILPDKATTTDLFRALIGRPLDQLAQALPGLTIVMIPSTRDVINKHASWPQDKVPKKGLGLPKNCFVVTNPMAFALNELAFAASSQDILYQLKRETCSKQTANSQSIIERLSHSVIEQRHFFPLFPATSREHLPKPSAIEDQDEEPRDALSGGASLDISYLALGEWQSRRPDILVMPSSMPPFVKVIESVIVINPGSVSRKRGPGNFGQIFVKPMSEGEQVVSSDGLINHEVYSRARADIMRI